MKFVYSRFKMAVLVQVLVLVLILVSGLAPRTSEALSCLAPADYIQQQLASSSDGLVFTGTVTKLHEPSSERTSNTVMVHTAHKGVVPEKVIIGYAYTKDWGYGCSSGPSQVGETKTFFTGPVVEGGVTGSLALRDSDPLYEVFVAAREQHAPTSTLTETATSTYTATESVSAWDSFRIKVEWFWVTIERLLGL